jgi:two-component system phosphate regulon response regulator PhoB
MDKRDILLVEDDNDIQQLVTYNLIKAGFNVTCADTGEEGLNLLDRERFDGIILDLMLPGKSGMEICRIVRQLKESKSIPIIMLTAKGEEEDIVAGLEAGADDYITKPFSPKVLTARVQAVIRRALKEVKEEAQAKPDVINIHSLTIHPGRHEVLRKGQPVHLTNTEFTILLLLAKRPGWVFTRQQIIDQVRGYDYLITPRAVDVQIFGLRKKLGSTGRYIETVRGVGYRMKE